MEQVISILNGIGGVLRAAQLLPNFNTPVGVFMAIAWTATALAVVLGVMSLFGGDADSDADVGADGDVGFFSTRAVVGFLLGVGWGGYCGIQAGLGTIGSVFVGLGVGLVMFFFVAFMMRFIYSLRVDGTLDYKTLEGLTGTVYVTIPPHGEPGGQVQISHPNQLITMAAVQDGDAPLPAQTRVVVVSASTSLVTVKPLR